MTDFNEYIHFDDLNISKEWFEIGNTRPGNNVQEILFKFVAYWISFNALFEKAWHGRQSAKEYKKIECYINEVFDSKLKGVIDFDNSPDLDIFMQYPVLGGNRRPDTGNYRCRPGSNSENNFKILTESDSEKERLISLIFTIKQVRNNLFHGSKTPSPPRNYYLVNSSQKILALILDALIEKRKK